MPPTVDGSGSPAQAPRERLVGIQDGSVEWEGCTPLAPESKLHWSPGPFLSKEMALFKAGILPLEVRDDARDMVEQIYITRQ